VTVRKLAAKVNERARMRQARRPPGPARRGRLPGRFGATPCARVIA